MTRTSVLLSIFTALCVMSGTAQAQKAGTYAGTTADGNIMSVSVTGSGGNFSFADASVNFTAHCKNPEGTTNEGWGFFLGAPVVPGYNDFQSSDDYYFIVGRMHFSNDNNTLKGSIISATAVFVPQNRTVAMPNGARFCKSPRQEFTLTYESLPTPPPRGDAVVLHNAIQ